MPSYVVVISSLVIVALAVFINDFADRFDENLNACGLGSYENGACQCVHPYVGKHCEIVDCGYGSLIDSLFQYDQITTKKGNYGCKCESKFWGFNCANCTSQFSEDCSGPCGDIYYGSRCDIMCKKGTQNDADGFAHAQSGGIYNFFIENQGFCLYDGSIKCKKGRAGANCQHQCKECVYGSCNKNDGTCDCFSGYYGELCNMTCPGRCSGNNGVCKDGVCDCDSGFTGIDCSLECCVRDSGTALGRVRGQCNPAGGCICDSGWSGPFCDCHDDFTCGGRGTCQNGTCFCEEQFQGSRCEMCNDLNIGPFCEYKRYQCPSREQRNGEFVAINSRGDHACKCNAGFQGKGCEECTPGAYPKNGSSMCSFVIPTSLCNRGTVRSSYDGSGNMCDCETNFDQQTDCQDCDPKYFGKDCEIYCDLKCTNSGGECLSTGCECLRGRTHVNGECIACGGDKDCEYGDCRRGKCMCDPGYYGDSCDIAAPTFNNLICNGFVSELIFETALCETDDDCRDSSHLTIDNRQTALRALQYNRLNETFCNRFDTPVAMRTVEGCCVDDNGDGKCDKAKLLENPCSGEIVTNICNERILEGEVNVFEWCLSKQQGCTKNGECVDPDLCQNRCDLGLAASEWVKRWEVDHGQSMTRVMSEAWKFPISFEDPYPYRSFYAQASLDHVCPMTSQTTRAVNSTLRFGYQQIEACPGSHINVVWEGYHNIQETQGPECNSSNIGNPIANYSSSGHEQNFTIELTASPGQTRYFKCDIHCQQTSARFEVSCPPSFSFQDFSYNRCRDLLIPETPVFNVTHKFTGVWEPMPSYHTCELTYHTIKTVNGRYDVQFDQPIWAGNIELVSDTSRTAAFGRLGQNNDSYYGNTSAYIDSLTLFGKGQVEVIIYNFTSTDCVDLMKKSASEFEECKSFTFYEFEYNWDDFCKWKETLGIQGGYTQRCYDQSLVCAGCENYQEGCVGLPLLSEFPTPYPLRVPRGQIFAKII